MPKETNQTRKDIEMEFKFITHQLEIRKKYDNYEINDHECEQEERADNESIEALAFWNDNNDYIAKTRHRTWITTLYDGVDSFVDKGIVEIIKFDNGNWGLWRSDDGALLEFIPIRKG